MIQLMKIQNADCRMDPSWITTETIPECKFRKYPGLASGLIGRAVRQNRGRSLVTGSHSVILNDSQQNHFIISNET